MRRLRRGFPERRTTFSQAVVVKREVRLACHLIAWLHAQGTSLAGCDQTDIDQWLADGSTYRHETRSFVGWAVRRGHAGAIEVPARSQANPRTSFIDSDERLSKASQPLHDTTLVPVDRVAGLLLLLFAQPLTRIAAITLDLVTRLRNVASSVRGRACWCCSIRVSVPVSCQLWEPVSGYWIDE